MVGGKTVRFGMIGCGGAAIPVAEAMHGLPNTRLTLTYDLNADLARDVAERFGAAFTTDLEALLASPEVDAIYIAVPHYLLAPLAHRVLEAGKHALVEKPMALSLADADELTALAAAKKLVLGVFYELRYSGTFCKARELVQAGVLGELIGAQIYTLIDKPLAYWQLGYSGRSVSSWRGERAKAGGGVVLMNVSHFLDGLWFVTGLNVVKVQAEAATQIAPVEVENIAAVTFRLENGALGSLFAGAHLAGSGGDERFTLYGTTGTLRVGDPYHNGPNQLYLRQEWNGLAANKWHTLEAVPVNVYEGAVGGFAEAVQTRTAAVPGGSDARRILNIVLSIYQAACEGRAVEIVNS